MPILTRLIIEKIKVQTVHDTREACHKAPVKIFAISCFIDAEEVSITKIQCVGVHPEDLTSENQVFPPFSNDSLARLVLPRFHVFPWMECRISPVLDMNARKLYVDKDDTSSRFGRGREHLIRQRYCNVRCILSIGPLFQVPFTWGYSSLADWWSLVLLVKISEESSAYS